MAARIGVVADTHCPEFLERLPDRLFEVLRGVDLILHAGDVGGPETLDRLRGLAPLEAVRGDHDGALRGLPHVRVLDIQGRRVVVVHGNRARLVEEPVTFVGTVTLGLFWPSPGLGPWLRRRFPDADVIIHGHTHRAQASWAGGALVFNPGAVYQVTPEAARARLAGHPGWFEWSWLQVVRHRRRVEPPTVGILEFGRSGIRTEILALQPLGHGGRRC